MHSIQSFHKKTFYILNSMLLCVVVAYILDPVILGAYFSQEVKGSIVGEVAVGIFLCLRVLFYSGIYGTIVEIVSGQEILLSMDRFKSNIKEYWKIYVCLSVLPVLIHMLLFGLVPYLDISLLTVKTLVDPVILYVLASFIISQKYIKPPGLPRRTYLVSLKELFVFVVIMIIKIALLQAVDMRGAGYSYLHRPALFLFRYVDFFVFTYIATIITSFYPEIKKKLSEEKEVFFVFPPSSGIVDAISSVFLRFYPPIFVVLRALTPKDYRIREFSQVFWRNKYYAENKLVAISCFTSNSPEAYKIAKEFKKRGSKVIMGGPHVTFLPDEALEFCDSVVIGDAEGVWADVIKDYEEGTLKPRYFGYFFEDCCQSVHQEMAALPPKILSQSLVTGRGCKFNCDFCVIPALCGRKIWNKPLPDIIELVKKVKQKRKMMAFLDNNIYADPLYAKELFKALKPLKIKWAASSSIDLAKDDKILQLARESGCSALLIGYEISDYSAESAKGKFSMAKDYRKLTKKLKKAGINVKGHFIYGFDTDSWKSLLNLWQFCFSIFPMRTVLTLLTPFPGSKLFYDMARDNRLLNLNWRNYNATKLVIKPHNLNMNFVNGFYPLIHIFFVITTSTFGIIAAFVLWPLFR